MGPGIIRKRARGKPPLVSLGTPCPKEFGTLFLVACAASNRTDELSAIARNEVVFRDSAVIFKQREGFIHKNQSQFHSPSMLKIPSLPGSPLCPVEAIREYLAVTQASSEPGLFLHPVSGKTLNAGRCAYFLVKTIR